MIGIHNMRTKPIGTREILVLIFSFAVLSFLVLFSDRDGYEGDDLNSIVPMFHLVGAKKGELLIYRYAWQPLSYELGAELFRLTKSPTAIFVLAPICGAASLVLLLLITWRDWASIAEFLKSSIVLLAVPEFWFSGLYYNSTIIGLPFVLFAVWMLFKQPSGQLVFIAGLFAGVAILMRLDFALACPALALIVWQDDRRLSRPLMLSLGVLVTLFFAFVAGLIDFAQIIEIHNTSSAEMIAKKDLPGWDFRFKLGVLSVFFSPLGWAIIAFGGCSVVYRAWRRSRLIVCLWIVAMVPLTLPLLAPLSAKYFVPMAIFLPPFMMHCLSAIKSNLSARLEAGLVPIAAVGTVALLFISISFSGKAPFAQIGTLASRPVGTHDGYRSYGGYLWQAAIVDRPERRSPHQLEAERIASEYLTAAGPDILIVGEENYFSPGAVGWRHLQLTLEKLGVHGRLVAPHQIEFDWSGRRLTLRRDLPQNTIDSYDQGRGIHLIDLRGL